jgi:hypothetical protein
MNAISVATAGHNGEPGPLLVPHKKIKDMTEEEHINFRRDYMRVWRDVNREHFREKCCIHSKNYYEAHKEEVLAGKRVKRAALLATLAPVPELH